MTKSTRIIIIKDRFTDTEIGQTQIQLTPHMDKLEMYRAAHIAITEWGEANNHTFNQLDWHWQPLSPIGASIP